MRAGCVVCPERENRLRGASSRPCLAMSQSCPTGLSAAGQVSNRPLIGHNGGVTYDFGAGAVETDDTNPVIDIAPEPELEPDSVVAAAVDLARAAAEELSPGTVGEHLVVSAEAPFVVTHSFAATLAGYAGWTWAVTLARVSESDVVTVDEVVLLPGAGALLAPEWVPWSERMRPGDLAPGDLVAPRPDDPRLVPAYADPDPAAFAETDEWDEAQVEQVTFELGLGRVHVMSREGRLDAADRWLAGDGGPATEMAKLAPAHCGTCGFFLSLAGSLSAAFGVCGNEMALADGKVVSIEHGCGAHSEAVVESTPLAEVAGAIYDDGDDIEATETAPTELMAESAVLDSEAPEMAPTE